MACQWRAVWHPIQAGWRSVRPKRTTRLPSTTPLREPETEEKSDRRSVDPAPPGDQVPTLLWLPGLALTIALGSWIMNVQYGMPILEGLLAFLLAFVLSFLTTQATGATGNTFILTGLYQSAEMSNLSLQTSPPSPRPRPPPKSRSAPYPRARTSPRRLSSGWVY